MSGFCFEFIWCIVINIVMADTIILIGMSGTGKSTVGELLAHRLGYAFVDTDRCMEQRFGKSIQEIVKEGPESFRQKEEEVILSLVQTKSLVIATGGSVVYSEKSMDYLKI